MNENEKNIRKNFLKFTESRYMKFVGGNDLVFSLIALVLLGIVIFIFEKVSYVFDPFIIV
ncbi:AI-2E family transporter, partial [Enterococcus faecalis]|nr:AI-2E family transporter [Staphylococcus aureus]